MIRARQRERQTAVAPAQGGDALRRVLLGAALLLPLFAGLAMLPRPTHAAAGETPLPYADNLPKLAADAARLGQPLVLMVSLTDCIFCEQIRRQQLAPLAKSGVPVWQIHLDTDGKVIGFDGKPTTERELAKLLKVRVAPTVLFFDQRGKQLAEPLVGTMLDDFYSAYLEDALVSARKQIPARR